MSPRGGEKSVEIVSLLKQAVRACVKLTASMAESKIYFIKEGKTTQHMFSVLHTSLVKINHAKGEL